MTTIDSHLLSTVTGGRQQQQAPQQPQQQAPQDDGGDPSQGQGQGQSCQGGGNFLSSIMGFLQSPQFSQILGGIQGLVSQFGGHGGQAQQQQQQ
ncbi:MAG TPA: hypothetical protein VGG74_23975 [Kofleriaceae bacterium]|jgi:hypothetical protein